MTAHHAELFPLLYSGRRRHRGAEDERPASIPLAMIAPHEAQAQRNHYQSLRRLAERGGLAPCEAVAVLEDREWHRMDEAAALARLAVLVAAFETMTGGAT